MSEAIVVQYNLIEDVTPEHRDIVEFASGQKLEELDIDDVNSFLNGLQLYMGEGLPWKN